MRSFQAFLILTTCVLTFAKPSPQDGVSADDILSNDSRYGQSSGAVSLDSLNAVFGIKGYQGTPKGKGTLVAPSPEKKKEPNYGTPAQTVIDSEKRECTYYFDAGYRCVPYYQCQNGTVVVDGGGLFDIRTGLFNVILDPEKSKCQGDLEVCCLHPDFEKPPIAGQIPPRPIAVAPPLPVPVPAITPEVQSNPLSPNPPIRNDPGAGGAYSPLTLQPPKPYTPQCGQRHYGGIGVRIKNQKEDGVTQFGEWPHMCAVLNRTIVNNEDVNLYVCGCSLISDRVVLTAAHCVHNLSPNNIKVRAGEWDTQKTIEPQVHQDQYGKHVSIHPGFSPLNLQNDFALIHLEKPFVLAPHIDTACLPDNLHIEGSFIPKNCFATGWGKDRFGKPGEYQVIMKKVQLDLVPQNICETQLRATRLGQYFNLDKSFTCAGGKLGKDTCTGDGGGPLVCPKGPGEDSYVQVGIVAWGIGCGDEIPGVYANVSQALCFFDWATRCVEGPQVNAYGFIGCEDWGRKEYCSLKANIGILTDQENLLSSDNYVEKGKIRRQRKKLEDLIPRYEAAITGCIGGNHDLSCGEGNIYGEFDLTPNQRDIGSINNSPRTALVEEVETEETDEGVTDGPPPPEE